MAIEDLLYPFLEAYIASPQWIKNSIGKAYSFVPTSVTRGSQYERFKREAELTDTYQIKQLNATKLAATLRSAIESVPAYQSYRHLLKHLDAPLEVLQELPLIGKENIKHDLSCFRSNAVPSKLGLKTFTGGSTAAPMVFYLQKGISRIKEYAFIESFHQRVGLSQQETVLALRGRCVPTAKRSKGPLWMYEPIKRQLILSSDHLERPYMAQYVEAMRSYKPAYIQAYPSAIYPLARWFKEHPAPDVIKGIKGILLFSENVFSEHMELLKEVFDCPVLKHYGQSERVLMAASMPNDDRYFFWPQYGHFELVDEAGNPITQPGVLGEIVGTSFDNEVMPFIRYRTGDMAILSERPHPLLPGFPVLESIEGRLQEFLVCFDHRLISTSSLSAAHSSELALAGVDAIQYEQFIPGHFTLNVVVTHSMSIETRYKIIRAMEAKMQGGCTMDLVEVANIPRTTRGKHRLLVQHLDISDYLAGSAN